MDRESLNIYLRPFLALEPGAKDRRQQLIEIAAEEDQLLGVLSEWLWELEGGLEQILELKLWFSLGYADLGRLFGFSEREVGQQMRTARLRHLGPYPPANKGAEEVPNFGGLSCFMVEQQFSQWMDSEWEVLGSLKKMREHLDQCEACYGRLKEYRKLQKQILERLPSVEPVSEEEWQQALRAKAKRFRRQAFNWFGVIAIIFLILFIFLWIIQSQPEKMPNIYEIPDDF
ncbi:MAG: hypothetical protein EA369_01130 [Bradymonadales bacterium]|nr:MAG: hypothetical protein EA369_01130 [Bradymonadales bacterium]